MPKSRSPPPLSAISVFAFFALTLSTFGFDYSSTITASGYAGEETLRNFPVLVKISPATIQGFDYSQLKHGNADIAFVSMDGGTEYPFEIDTWDTSGTSFVWVKLELLSEDAEDLIKTYDPGSQFMQDGKVRVTLYESDGTTPVASRKVRMHVPGR